jgi:transcriptional regulator with XRE-family HTH domain
MSVHKIFRERLRATAKERGRGIYKQIAYKSGYTDGYIRGLANSGRNPTIGAVWAIAEALEVNPHYLLGGTDDPTQLQ